MSTSPVQLQALADWPLLEASSGGDRRAGAIFIQRYSALLTRFFRNKVRDAEDSKELVSETMMRCMEGVARVHKRDSFRSYMFGIAINVLRNHVRKQYKRQRERDDFDEVCVAAHVGGSPPSIVAQKRESRLLVRGLRRIPLKFQIVLELQLIEGMAATEIAELLGMPQATVYTNQTRGRERLQKEITFLTDDAALVDSTMVGIRTWAKDVRAQIGAARPH